MIEFFFDCSSPWTWLAFHNLQPLARELGVEVRWRPVLVGGIFNAVNPSVYEFRERGVPAKQAYLKKDLAGLGAARGPRDPVPADGVPGEQRQGDARLHPARVARESWCRSPRRCSRPTGPTTATFRRTTVLADLCGRVGVEPGRFLEGIAAPEVKAQLKANTDEVIARGGFGSPTIFVGDDMYFGNDRLALVREAVLRGRASSQGKTTMLTASPLPSRRAPTPRRRRRRRAARPRERDDDRVGRGAGSGACRHDAGRRRRDLAVGREHVRHRHAPRHLARRAAARAGRAEAGHRPREGQRSGRRRREARCR